MLRFNQLTAPLSAKPTSSDATLIYIHGIGGSCAVWYFDYILHFYGQCHQIAYDLRGHGASDYPLDGYHVSNHADDLHQIANQEGVFKRRRCFIGYSYGGCVLMEYAVKFATPEDKLIVLDAPFVDRINQQVVEELQELRLALLGEIDVPVGPLASELIATMGEIDPKQRAIARYADRLKRLFETRFAEQSIANQSPTPERLKNVPCEVLLVYAKQADCLPFGQYLAEHLPQCRLVTVDAKHDLVSTHAAQIRQLIQEFSL